MKTRENMDFEYEQNKFRKLLREVYVNPENLIYIEEIYDYYCKGCYFLQKIVYIQSFIATYSIIYDDIDEKFFLIYGLDYELRCQVQNIITLFNYKKLIFTDFQPHIIHFQDLRTDEERSETEFTFL